MSNAIGFIGLGHLGLPMATNLVEGGFVEPGALAVYNRTASKVAQTRSSPAVCSGRRGIGRRRDAGESSASVLWDATKRSKAW